MCVDDNHGDDDRSNDEDHGEEHVFANERNGAGRGRDQLHDNQQEHGERKQDGDAEGHLLTYTNTRHLKKSQIIAVMLEIIAWRLAVCLY